MKKLIGVLIIVAVVAIASITIYKQTRTLEGIYEDLHSSTHHVLFEQGMLEDYYTSCRWNSYYKGNEENAKLCMEQADYLNLLEEPYTPYELFYTFKVTDGAYVSQGRFEHANRNGLLADDVATNGKKLKLYAPDLHNEMVDWEVTEEVNKLKGNTIILTNENNRFEIGHSKLTVGEGVVATGNTIGEVLCAGDENVGYVTGGCHIHFTYEVYDGKLWNETPYYTDVNYDADKVVEEKMVKKEKEVRESGIIKFTTYNPEVGQTDDSPCQGAWGNVCDLYKEGLNPIALSRDLIKGRAEYGYCTENCPYVYGDVVLVEPVNHWQSPFKAIVADTMNIRYTNRGDLFKDNRSKNTSFDAYITKINS